MASLTDLLHAHETRRGPTHRELLEWVREEKYRQEREGSWAVGGLIDPLDPGGDGTDPLAREHDELLEILLCPSCDMELRAPVCSPVHALLQDNPLQHRLLLPLVEREITQVRHDTTKICNICPGKIPIAQGDCNHIVDRHGQVWMSKKSWEKLIDEVTETRREMADLEDRHNAYADSVAIERKRMEDDRERFAAGWALSRLADVLDEGDWDGTSFGQFADAFNGFLKSLEEALGESDGE